MNIQIPDMKTKVYVTLEEAQKAVCPLRALMGRVLVVQVYDPEIDAPKSNLYIPDSAKQAMYPNFLRKAVVKSVGPINTGRQACVKEGDIVYVHPGGFTSVKTVGNIEYMVYGELDLEMAAVNTENVDTVTTTANEYYLEIGDIFEVASVGVFTVVSTGPNEKTIGHLHDTGTELTSTVKTISLNYLPISELNKQNVYLLSRATYPYTN